MGLTYSGDTSMIHITCVDQVTRGKEEVTTKVFTGFQEKEARQYWLEELKKDHVLMERQIVNVQTTVFEAE